VITLGNLCRVCFGYAASRQSTLIRKHCSRSLPPSTSDHLNLMANVLHPQHIEFPSGSITHAPTPLGFGFGLSAVSTSSGFGCMGNPPAPFPPFHQQVAHSTSQPAMSRSQKRARDPDEDDNDGRASSRDIAMDRSPTPERPRRTIPKRARMSQSVKEDKGKGVSMQAGDASDDVDAGVLLGLSVFLCILSPHSLSLCPQRHYRERASCQFSPL
jgi:hypothetical protein